MRRSWWEAYEAKMMWVKLSHSGNGVVSMGEWKLLPQRLKSYWIRKAREQWDARELAKTPQSSKEAA